METSLTDITSTALIQKDIGYMRSDIVDIKQILKELAGVYATKIFVDDAVKAVDLRLKRLEDASKLWSWLSPTLSAIASATMTFLIINYIKR